MSLFASVSLIFVLLTLEYAFAFIMFYSDDGRYLNLRMICEYLERQVFICTHIWIYIIVDKQHSNRRNQERKDYCFFTACDLRGEISEQKLELLLSLLQVLHLGIMYFVFS